MIRVEQLVFGHGRRIVGRIDQLDVPPGRVTAFLGPNGVGKTTLFRTLLGLQKQMSGRVLVDGMDLAAATRQQIARRIAYVPQAHMSFFAFSVLDVVLMGRAPWLAALSPPGGRDREMALAALETLGIAALARRPYTEISGGERQLTLIARALAQDTPYLVLDEPTSSLDYGNQHRMLELTLSLAKAGKGIVLSTHQPDHVLRIADQVVLMTTGEDIAIGTPADVVTPARLKAAYGLDVTIGAFPGTRQTMIIPLGPAGNQHEEKRDGAAQ